MSEPWQIIEALLFASPESVSSRRLANATNLAPSEVEACIQKLNRDYEGHGRSFQIRKLAGGWQMVTLPRFAPWIARLLQRKGRGRLSTAALETLAVIAHRQPINKPDIDQARGIESSYILSSLLERGIIRIKGRDKRAGHPYVYVTTPKFLEFFGLASLEELPDLEEPAVKEEDILPLEADQETEELTREEEKSAEVSSEALAAIGYRIEKKTRKKEELREEESSAGGESEES
ncbi:SMC-Scp complex subunit ScpB [candidate division TA06 bacterium B3_TA06]|uniref:SMC-Scp complex subunit ScpB n=1 Tax=candidate division TA06 bacterium B3_TA06 TaxID=2012487 RepID=A0A532V986_UNCT6|nr:MAG: SMC-Scp complex subunit ScpB [candidate division TA06 bacterium B3_TA06]